MIVWKLISLLIFVLALIANLSILRSLTQKVEYIKMMGYFSSVIGYKDEEDMLFLLKQEQLILSRQMGLIRCKLLTIANDDNLTFRSLAYEIKNVYSAIKETGKNSIKINRWIQMLEKT